MYVNFEYYMNVYGGFLLTEQDFAIAERNAEDYIRYLTYLNGNIFADTVQADTIKRTVCAAAEAYHAATMEQQQGGNVKSENKDGMNVSFIVARKDGETVDEYVKRSMYQVVRPRLLPAGWLSRRAKVGV